jgi:hypothetical protein
MSVSKQDWKDYHSKQWAGGSCKPAVAELLKAVDDALAAIDGGDVGEFLSYTEDDGKLMAAAQKASSAASDALSAIEPLRLDGNQRRFANKTAISTSDAAVASVKQLQYACDLLVTGLVRGVRLEHDQVERDPAAMASVKSGNLVSRLNSERWTIQSCVDDADAKLAALAAVDKIGVV